jgi:hypothetical protein
VVSNNLVFSETSVDLHSRLHRLHVHYVHYTFSGTFFPLALAIFYSAVIKSLCKNSVVKEKMKNRPRKMHACLTACMRFTENLSMILTRKGFWTWNNYNEHP